jgi:aspartokinase/homoserine dehydrogenase 1
MAFTLSETTASIVLLGSSGAIGRAFVDQLRNQRRTLIDDLSVCLRVMITANSRSMIFAETAKGLPIDALNEQLLGDEAETTDLDRISAEIEADVNPHRVIIDCTNSEEISEYYERWMSAGIDIISPSRKIVAGPLDRYDRVCKAQRENSASWQFSSSVGSALPVLATLQDLVETGDKVHKVRGSVSGTLAYILSIFDEKTTFSQALAQAVEKDFAESDIREDLGGKDMARKVVILARQLGINIELEDVEVESFLTEEMAANDNLKAEDFESIDADMLKKFKEAKANDCVLRYKFEIVKETGKCRCFLDAVDNTDTLYRLKSIENLVAFETDRYSASPMIIKGAAAGPDLAAAGIFSDLLRLTRAYSSERL